MLLTDHYIHHYINNIYLIEWVKMSKIAIKKQNGLTITYYIGKKDKRKPPDTVVYGNMAALKI